MSNTNTVPALLLRAAEAHADNESFVFPGSRQSYAELLSAATDVAAALTAMGIGKGDAVGALMPNCQEFTYVLFGAALAGATFVPFNARLAPRELAYVVPDSGVRVLFTTDVVDEHVDYVSRLYDALPGLAEARGSERPAPDLAPALERVVLFGGRTRGGLMPRSEFLAQGHSVDRQRIRDNALAVAPQDPYIMMYTSGTTSMPKGCPLSHRSVVELGVAVGEEGFGITEADRMWNPLPMFHVSAQAPMIAVLNAGATYISTVHFDVEEALASIVAESATIAYPAYPTLTGPMLESDSYRPETFAKVRALLTVGPPDVLRRYQALLPYTSHVSCYGSTETGGVAVMGRLDAPLEQRLTCGRPFTGVEISIRDLVDRVQVPAGVTGEIHVRGYNLFLGYHNDPQKTAASIDAAGWFATGDLGSVDEEGNLTFQGRAKDMLKVGGENVGCLEVETFLLGHPDVIMSAVVGMPDPKYGEVPAAFVELRSGAAVTAAELIEYCAKGMAKYKVPRQVEMITEWPMSATKIQKGRLLERLKPPVG
ncbi:AMP-binding protein [Nocardia sp. NPDC050799]|uniref:class I adenylate-forming enzyme family protein n=1 Tax=Nocardia sp. NPDC050799 TaxID=3154842 RepID=UPI0033DAAEE5